MFRLRINICSKHKSVVQFQYSTNPSSQTSVYILIDMLTSCNIFCQPWCKIICEPGNEKTCLMPYGNNKGADQPAHPRSLISAFGVHSLDSIVPILAKSKILRLQLVLVGEQAGLSLTWSQTPGDTFSHDEVHYIRDCAPSEDSDKPSFNGLLRTQGVFMRTAKTLIRLGGCPGWCESSLGAQSLCWFCHVAAHLF